jgi:hypothetical protein
LQLLIEGVCGDGALGDIAVDDISVVHKNCSQVHNGKNLFRQCAGISAII